MLTFEELESFLKEPGFYRKIQVSFVNGGFRVHISSGDSQPEHYETTRKTSYVAGNNLERLIVKAILEIKKKEANNAKSR